MNEDAINNLNANLPRCYDQDNKTVVFVQEENALFATKMRVFLAPGGRCSYLALGDTKLEWDVPTEKNQRAPIWNYVLNYTGTPCSLYGGNTFEDA